MKVSHEIDRRVGRNVAALRASRGLTQVGLAERMIGRGVYWHQQTVAKVERGTRSLRVEEVVVLAEVFGVAAKRLWAEENPS